MPQDVEKLHFSLVFLMNIESTVVLFIKINSFFLKNQYKKFSLNFFPEKSVQLIDFTRIIHVNVNNIYIF